MICTFILFLIYSISGTLLHFLFKLSNKNIVVGIIASVNESVWEHIKLLLTPIFFLSFIKFYITKNNNYFVLSVELLTAITLIIVFNKLKLFLFKNKYNFINLIFFYLTCLIVAVLNCTLKNIDIPNSINLVSLFIVMIIFIMYLTFTVFPLKNDLFKDPVCNTYGLDDCVNESV